jgi:hypothetical protein
MKRPIKYSLALVGIVLIIPIKQACKVPGHNCAYLGENGKVCYVYDSQPVFVSVIEAVVKQDLPIKFASGTKCY